MVGSEGRLSRAPVLARSAHFDTPLASAAPSILDRDGFDRDEVRDQPDQRDRRQRTVYTYDFPSFHSQRLDEQLAQYTAYLKTHGPPDVLILGSSRSLQGIDPQVLAATLEDEGWGEVTVYNFSVNGATAKVVDVIFRQVLDPEHLPRLVIWGDGSRAFNSGRPDATYERLTASPGYRRLVTEGDRPIQSIVLQSSPQLSRLLRGQAEPSCWPAENPEASTVDPWLSSSGDCAPAPSPIATDLTPQGFLPIADRFDPAVYYQGFPRVSGQYDGSYVPFQLQGEQTQASVAIVNYARQQGIPLVLVNLPLSQDYLDPVRQSYEQQFQLHLRQLAIAQGFTLVDLNQPDFQRNDLFADPSHINQVGAVLVSEAIARDPMVPWEVLLEP
ncbi:MAG: hypothetical protein EA367_09405 [Leptolyngbya sp. DLM2.Bin15]|nr:MAG: hypothetical protein EA367_09405 [Leptolyngbya sp. DLM2.Bin15]